MNFSINLELVSSDKEKLNDLNITKGSYSDVLKVLMNGTTDFSTNLYIITDPDDLVDFQFTQSIKSSSVNFVIKQNAIQAVAISENLIIFLIVSVLALLLIILLIRILKFDNESWTIYDIALLLIGRPISTLPKSTIEKVFYILLLFISSTFSIEILKTFIEYFYNETFFDLKTLNDIVKANFTVAVSEEFYTVLFNGSDTTDDLKYLLPQVRIMKKKEIEKCFEWLLDGSKNVHGCYMRDFMGLLIANFFSKNNSGWIFSFVDEPLLRSLYSVLLAKTSPYIYQFDSVLRRYSECGLVEYWSTAIFFNYSLKTSKILYLQKRNYLNINNMYLTRNLLFMLILVDLLACFILLVEFVLKCVKVKFVFNIKKRMLMRLRG